MKDFAAAVDLGTTTLAASMIDCATGQRVAQAGCINPQTSFGADVITRLDVATSSPAALREMSQVVNGAVQSLVAELMEKAGDAGGRPMQVAIAGNPAMEHLFLGLPVDSLARLPYRPLFKRGIAICSTESGWTMQVPLYLFPLPGGFVGGDLVAFLHAFPAEDTCLYLDLGTNGEIALACNDKIYATSVAAGPAFEGGNLSCGMAALDGAISGVSLRGERVAFETTGGSRPIGICGSGVIDAIAGLLDYGVIDRSGRLLSPAEIPNNLANRVENVQGDLAFVLYRDATGAVYLTQQDIRQFQLAKGAVVGGIEVLLGRAGLSWSSLDSILIAGSFGSKLDPESLKTVGFLSQKMVKVTRFVSDGVIAGVEKTVWEKDGLKKVESLAERLSVVPLSGNPQFEQAFMQHMDFAAPAS